MPLQGARLEPLPKDCVLQGARLELLEPVTSKIAIFQKLQSAVNKITQEKAAKRQLTLNAFRAVVQEITAKTREQLMTLSTQELREEAKTMAEYSEELERSIMEMTGKAPPRAKVSAKHEANASLFKEAAAMQRELMELRDSYHKQRNARREMDAQPQVQRASTQAQPQVHRASTLHVRTTQGQRRVSVASSVTMDFPGSSQSGAAASQTAGGSTPAETFQRVSRRMSLTMKHGKVT
jgi:hypothetical protein